MRMLAGAGLCEATVIEMLHDYRAGVLPDWPEGHPAGLVEAVRTVDAESSRWVED